MADRGGREPSTSIAQKLIAFVRESKRNILLQRITKVMAVFVVFITTYMLILPAITETLTTAPVSGTAELDITDVYYERAEYDGTDYTASLTVSFSISVSDLLANDYTASYSLPSTVTPPSSYEAGTVRDSDDGHFTYYYDKDAAGNWYIYITVKSDYVDTLNNSSYVTGYFTFYATIDDSAADSSGDIKITFDENVTLTIPASEITTPHNETASTDINVTKTSSGYNADGNYIEYTITVYTEKGTGEDITLSDALSNLSSLSVTDITVESVTYYELDSSGNVSGTGEEVGDTEYIFTYTSGDTGFTMTLPELDGSATDDTLAAYGSEYVIVYRVYLDEISGNVYTTTKNAVTATADTIYDTPDQPTSVTVSHSVLSKTGSVSNDGNTITWTITVNASNVNIAGYVLTDAMLSEADAGSLTITSSNDDVEDTVTYTYDSEDNVTAIAFSAASESTENTATYTITYTTTAPANLSGGTNVTNTAELADDDGTVAEASSSPWVSGSGSIDKKYVSSSYDSETDTYTVNWSYTIEVPEGGIAAGTSISDYLGDTEYQYNAKNTQYFTYEQVYAFLEEQHTSQSYYNYYDNLPYYVVTKDSSWAEAIQQNPYYTISFYDATDGTWVEASTLLTAYNQSSNDFENHVFTAFKIVFDKDYVNNQKYGGTITLYYSTTLYAETLTSGSVSSLTTTNSAYIEKSGSTSLKDSASYTAYATVTKTDGNGSTSDSFVTTSDGVITWKVRIYVPDTATSSDGDFTVTDTLPAGVTVNSLYLYNSANSSYKLTSSDADSDGNETYGITLTNGSGAGCTITATVEEKTDIDTSKKYQVVAMTIPASWYADYAGDVFWITYVCDSQSTSESEETISYTNRVEVKLNEATYGSDDQTQRVTYSKTNMSKSAVYDETDQELDYTLVINPDAADLVENSDTVTLTDQLQAYMNGEYGQYAALVQSSVKFYYLYAMTDNGNETYTYSYNSTNGGGTVTQITGTVSSEDENIYTYTDKNGDTVYYYKAEADIAWTFEGTNNSTGWNYYTITADLPDSTAILLQYSYKVYALNNGTIPKDSSDSVNVSLTNYANLRGGSSGSTSDTSSFKYYDAGFSAGLTGLTVYKVDSGDYSNTLSGAEFDVYKYTCNSESQIYSWVKVKTITNTDGTIVLNKNSIGDENFTFNTAYYIVESKAPSGYILDSTTHVHFYWSNSDTTTYPECYPDGFLNNGLSDGEVYDLTYFTQDIYFENTKIPTDTTTSVTVEKEWVDSEGNAITSDLPDGITVSLYQYEEGDVADSDDDNSGSGSTADTVNVYFCYGLNIYGASMVSVLEAAKGEDLNLSIDAGDSQTVTYYGLYTYSSYQYSELTDSSGNNYYSWYYNSQTLSLSVPGECVTQNIYVCYYTSTYSENDYGTVSTGNAGGDTAMSGYSASDLPKDSNGDYAGTKYGTYTLDSSGDWSRTISDLPYVVYDTNGVKHTYYYYFVEETVNGYYTTYSSSEGVTDGGSLIITNTQLPTTEISVEKKWQDANGNEITDTSKLESITVDLYRTEEAAATENATGDTTDTVTVTINYGSDWSNSYNKKVTKEVPKETSFTITITEANQSSSPGGYTAPYVGIGSEQWDGNSEWLTFKNDIVVDETYVTQDITFYIMYVSDVSITYTGENAGGDTGSDTTYYSADLPTDGTYIGSYTLSNVNDWTETIKDLPSAYVDENGTLHNYYYYFRESAVKYYDTTYSTASGVQSGTITITNTYNPNRKYTGAKVTKVWKDSTGAKLSESSLTSASATFQLWQVLMDSSGNYLQDSDSSDSDILVIPFGSPVTVNNSVNWSVTWVTLPTTTTYDSEEYTCVYFVTEVSATLGTEATFTSSFGASSENVASKLNGAGCITVDGVTYYAITVGDTNNESTPPLITVTNTTDKENDTINITVAKQWQNSSGTALSNPASAEVTFTLLKVELDSNGNVVKDSETVYGTSGTLSTGGTWSYTWENLPKTCTNKSGNTCEYQYYVVESSARYGSQTSSFAESYSVSGTAITTTYVYDGITYYLATDGSAVTVTNTTQDSVILPVTGGRGIRNLILITGGTLMLFAIAVILARQRRIRRWSS